MKPSRGESLSAIEHTERTRQSMAMSVAESLDRPSDRELLKYLVKKCQGGTLVDVGCGMGGFGAAASAFFVVAAFDLSGQAVRLVPKSIGMKWIGTGGAIPLRSDSVDLVTCLDVVEHLPNPEPCIAETHR